MKYTGVKIESMGICEPDQYLSSSEFESRLEALYTRLKLPVGRIEMQTGIASRGVFDEGTLPSDISTRAAVKCLLNSEIPRSEIDLLIHSSVCRNVLEPSTSSFIHQNLGLSSSCMSYDLSNACLGFINSIDQAARQISAGAIRHALIVTGENATPLINSMIELLKFNTVISRKEIKKYFANFTIGSAGVAYLLTKSEGTSGLHVKGSVTRTDSSANTLCQGNGDTNSLMMETNSEELLHAGIKLAKTTWDAYKDELSIDQNKVSKVLTHQVGHAHDQLLFETLGLKGVETYHTYPKYGNTGSAALPLTLAKAVSDNFISKGDAFHLLGIGSGLHSTMMELEWI